MFMVSEFDPQVIYTAEACGLISRIDLRSDSSTSTLFKNKRKFYGGTAAKLSSVKAIAQSRALGEHSLVFGGQGLDIRQIDIRMIDVEGDRSGSNKGVIRQWGPQYLNEREGTEHLYPSKRAMLSAAMSHVSFKRQCELGSAIHQGSLSLSGLQISQNGRMMVASYQGDQIYTFDLFGRSEQELIRQYYVPNPKPTAVEEEPVSAIEEFMGDTDNENTNGSSNSSSNSNSSSAANPHLSNGFSDPYRAMNWDGIYNLNVTPTWSESHRRGEGLKYGCGVGANAVFGGHQNYQTFLKQVAFFGPRDEYVVSGSDSGDMFIWDTRSGRLLVNGSNEQDSKSWGKF
jgi:WD40 repeat protein